MAIEIGKGETHGRDCLSCWKCRHSFDAALAWWRAGNTGFMPAKLSGPRFAIELCKAYGNRMQGNTPSQRKGKTAKELREEAARWRSRFDRLKGEHVKWAQEDNREPRVLYVIEREIAAEETESEFPVEANYTDQDNTSGTVADTEQKTNEAGEVIEDSTSGVVVGVKRKGGWPKGKPRGRKAGTVTDQAPIRRPIHSGSPPVVCYHETAFCQINTYLTRTFYDGMGDGCPRSSHRHPPSFRYRLR
jgi:hypothetical protein